MQEVRIRIMGLDCVQTGNIENGKPYKWQLEYELCGQLSMWTTIEISSGPNDHEANEARRIGLVTLRDFLQAASRQAAASSPWDIE